MLRGGNLFARPCSSGLELLTETPPDHQTQARNPDWLFHLTIHRFKFPEIKIINSMADQDGRIVFDGSMFPKEQPMKMEAVIMAEYLNNPQTLWYPMDLNEGVVLNDCFLSRAENLRIDKSKAFTSQDAMKKVNALLSP